MNVGIDVNHQQIIWSLHNNGGQVYEDKMVEVSSDHIYDGLNFIVVDGVYNYR